MNKQPSLKWITRPQGCGTEEQGTQVHELSVFVHHIKLQSLNQVFRGLSERARWYIITEARKQRMLVAHALRTKPKPEFPLVVTVTRIAPGKGLDPHDNLPGACKHVVDEIAAWLDIDDRDTRVSWRYAQASCGQLRAVWLLFERKVS